MVSLKMESELDFIDGFPFYSFKTLESMNSALRTGNMLLYEKLRLCQVYTFIFRDCWSNYLI